LLGKRIENLWR